MSTKLDEVKNHYKWKEAEDRNPDTAATTPAHEMSIPFNKNFVFNGCNLGKIKIIYLDLQNDI